MRRIFLTCLIGLGCTTRCLAQISPPGLGKAKGVSWFAFGVKQDLDTAQKWQSMSYIGIGRKSDPDNYKLFLKPAILVINQEFSHAFHERWKYSFALSYRRQNEYDAIDPYEPSLEPIRPELRLYGRLAYQLSASRVKFTTTFRQEFRKFLNRKHLNEAESLALRSRLRFQIGVNLDEKKVHQLKLGYESLFEVSKMENPSTWTDFSYQESRFTFYYILSPEKLPITFDLGYMNDLIDGTKPFVGHYLALDIVLKNPFGIK